MTKIKLGHNTKGFSEATKNNKEKFDAAENIINYINAIVGKSGSFKIEEALSDPMKYIRGYFYDVHASTIPSFVKKDKAIDLSDYNETDFKKLVDIYNKIDAMHPIEKGKLTHIEALKSDFDLFLNEAKKEEYEALKSFIDSANKLQTFKTTYFSLDQARNAIGTRAKFNIDSEYNRTLVVDNDYFIG